MRDLTVEEMARRTMLRFLRKQAIHRLRRGEDPLRVLVEWMEASLPLL